ncbi:unnamed protein product [Heligmosomoides polygyrus]|uniref:Uncharacterized protein n=1 Tax=Heligmosomoides polygyrus TaxID=6339 RepID=A0A183G6S8_HELPZ|nr:unnamed protein product [Heligmosomoides polygyrus]
MERNLTRAEIESAQLMLYNLRLEIDEMENQNREENSLLSVDIDMFSSVQEQQHNDSDHGVTDQQGRRQQNRTLINQGTGQLQDH